MTRLPFPRSLALARRALSATALLWASVPAHAQAPYATPEAAADAFIDAISRSDQNALAHVLGKTWRKLMPPGGVPPDSVAAFVEKARQSRTVRADGKRGDLIVGTDPWTLPVPLVQGDDGKWRFDPVVGSERVADQRIGANERAAVLTVQAYVDAQREYATADRDGDGVLEYAQKFRSSPGKRDGLIWSAKLGDDSPLGERYLPDKDGQGYHGFRYKILTGQGPLAEGGSRNYLIGKRMTAGFALLAWPVRYGETGVMSFISRSDGVVFERDLGPGTAEAATRIRNFNPDDAWKRVKP